MFMGRRHDALVVGDDAVRTEVHGNLNGRLFVQGFVGVLKGFSLRCSGCIAEHRLIDRVGDVESSVGHCG